MARTPGQQRGTLRRIIALLSCLLVLLSSAFVHATTGDVVDDGGDGRWAHQHAITDQDDKLPVLTAVATRRRVAPPPPPTPSMSMPPGAGRTSAVRVTTPASTSSAGSTGHA